MRFGITRLFCFRPLVNQLQTAPPQDISVAEDNPAVLAERFRMGEFDVALVPTIEYLRGVGSDYVSGPALVAKPGRLSHSLLAQKPITELNRIAVAEHCRTGLAVLRIVLAEQYSVFPDMLVEQNVTPYWRDRYDAVLVSGDRQITARTDVGDGAESYDITQWWSDLTGHPLVSALWVYRDETMAERATAIVTAARNAGVSRLSEIADEVAREAGIGSEVSYEFLANSWDYELTADSQQSILSLETLACKYDLIRSARLGDAVSL